jgi:hypothetical protein
MVPDLLKRDLNFVGDEEDVVRLEALDVEAVSVTPPAFIEVDVKPENIDTLAQRLQNFFSVC